MKLLSSVKPTHSILVNSIIRPSKNSTKKMSIALKCIYHTSEKCSWAESVIMTSKSFRLWWGSLKKINMCLMQRACYHTFKMKGPFSWYHLISVIGEKDSVSNTGSKTTKNLIYQSQLKNLIIRLCPLLRHITQKGLKSISQRQETRFAADIRSNYYCKLLHRRAKRFIQQNL